MALLLLGLLFFLIATGVSIAIMLWGFLVIPAR
jgi:hypothetical protein